MIGGGTTITFIKASNGTNIDNCLFDAEEAKVIKNYNASKMFPVVANTWNVHTKVPL